jgi:hypothetical protein
VLNGNVIWHKPFTLMREYYVWNSKEIKRLLENMALASSANILRSDKVFIVRGRSFMYLMKTKVPRINPLGNYVFYSSPGLTKILWVLLGDFIRTFCFPSVFDRIWTTLQLFLEYHIHVIYFTRFHDLHSQKFFPKSQSVSYVNLLVNRF